MKCPNCRSEMFVTDETSNARSHVTFYRCSLCVGEHVSSEPVVDHTEDEHSVYFDAPSSEKKRYLVA